MALVHSPLRAHELKKLAICGTTSQAWRIGRAIAGCRKSKYVNRLPIYIWDLTDKNRNLAHVAKAITEVQDGAHLFTGKVRVAWDFYGLNQRGFCHTDRRCNQGEHALAEKPHEHTQNLVITPWNRKSRAVLRMVA